MRGGMSVSLPRDVDPYVEHVPGTRRDREVTQTPLAFLVDGDNASAKLIKEMLAEASKYGTGIIRNVYGDWTSTQLAPWKEILQEYALEAEQQFANVSGKNATDSKMIIDAMDILHEGIAKGFCLVSSDSDYTALAKRTRKVGVVRHGNRAGPDACGVPAGVPHLRLHGESRTALSPPLAPLPPAPGQAVQPRVPAVAPRSPRVQPSGAQDILQRAFDSLDPGDGLVHLANLGATLYRLDPAFDPRTYGKAKLVHLIQAFPDMFAVERPTELGAGAVYVRRKKA